MTRDQAVINYYRLCAAEFADRPLRFSDSRSLRIHTDEIADPRTILLVSERDRWSLASIAMSEVRA